MRNPNIHEHPTSQLCKFGFTRWFDSVNWTDPVRHFESLDKKGGGHMAPKIPGLVNFDIPHFRANPHVPWSKHRFLKSSSIDHFRAITETARDGHQSINREFIYPFRGFPNLGYPYIALRRTCGIHLSHHGGHPLWRSYPHQNHPTWRANPVTHGGNPMWPPRQSIYRSL